MKHAALLSVLFLSACGGSVVRPVTVTAPVPTPAPLTVVPTVAEKTYQTRDADRRALLNDFAALDLTSPYDLPATGTLTYDGHLNAQLGDRADVIGDLEVEVDIGREEIRGSASNFVDQSNGNYTGQLDLFNGTFDEDPQLNEYQSSAQISGTLQGPSAHTYAVNGQLAGDVLGNSGDAFEGVLSGFVKVDGGGQEAFRGGAVAVQR